MKKIIAAALTALTLVFSAHAAEAPHTQTVEMEVDGLVCAFCAQGIEKKLRGQAATQDVYVSLERRLVAIALKPGQTLADDVLKGLLTEAGYTVQAVKHTQTPLAQLRASTHE